MAERLQKWLAGQGLGSRRELEGWIAAGRVSVDGETAVLGQKVTGEENILVDGRRVVAPTASAPTARTLVYHKPIGEICTRSDPEGRPTVFENLPRLRGRRWISIGRLDVQTSGLLLFTTDGDLAHRAMHPGAGLDREYAVRVQGELDEASLQQLRHGVELDDGPARFDHLEIGGGEGQNRWYRVVVSEGRNRVVRRLFEAVGGRVSRLIRVRFGPLVLPRDVKRGRFRDLELDELQALYAAVGLPAPAITPPERKSRPAAHARRKR